MPSLTDLEGGLAFRALEVSFVTVFKAHVVLQLLLRDAAVLAMLKNKRNVTENNRFVTLDVFIVS